MNDWQSRLRRWICNACVAEVSFHKPGNVSLTEHFADAVADDFVQSAQAVAPVIATSGTSGIGQTVLDAVVATRNAVGHNTNLGIILLLAPLAAVPEYCSLLDGIESRLSSLTVDDARLAYRAIDLAAPAGLGKASRQDLAETPTENLRDCMQLAKDQDLIAAQYTNGFQDVLVWGLHELLSTRQWPDEARKWRIGWLAVNLMARHGDSLIQRKCGFSLSQQVQTTASDLLKTGWPLEPGSHFAYENFDQFLRADGHRRNPGTTADMIAAILFAAFREGMCSFDETATDLVFIDDQHD